MLGVLSEVLDAFEQGVVIVDGDGNELVRNLSAMGLVGDRQADALVAAALQQVLRADGPLPGEQVLRLHLPAPRTVVVRARPLASGGTVAIIEDVSERMRVDAVRREFVTNVSHELRTPVGAITVLADALAEERDPEVVRRLARRLAEEAERVGAMIEELLDLGRIEAEGSAQTQQLDINEILDAAEERVRPLAEQRGIEVVRDNGRRLSVSADRSQLVSAVANLLDNAAKYSPEGARIWVSARAGPEGVEIEVRDEGIGIPSHDLDRIFERFYRVDPARSRETGGAGLGLSIVRHAVLNHGGEVRVNSREGEGSTFTIVLPKRT